MTSRKMTTVTHADGSYSHVFDDGITFGPYGPGRCEAVHPSGNRCDHGRGHVGCHSANDPGPVEFKKQGGSKFKYRWTDHKESAR